MVISFRVSTVAALFIGLSAGIFLGAIGAQQIATNWPEKQNFFTSVVRFPAPEQLRFGKLKDGTTVLCDKKDYAYSLVDYGEHSDPEIPHRVWSGFQELEPLYEHTNEPANTKDEYSVKPATHLFCE